MDDGAQPPQRQGQEASVGQRQVDRIRIVLGCLEGLQVESPSRDHGDDRVDEVDTLAVDRNTEVKLEPIDAGPLDHLRIEVAVGNHQLKREVRRDVDGPALRPELGDDVVKSIEPREFVAFG